MCLYSCLPLCVCVCVNLNNINKFMYMYSFSCSFPLLSFHVLFVFLIAFVKLVTFELPSRQLLSITEAKSNIAANSNSSSSITTNTSITSMTLFAGRGGWNSPNKKPMMFFNQMRNCSVYFLNNLRSFVKIVNNTNDHHLSTSSIVK